MRLSHIRIWFAFDSLAVSGYDLDFFIILHDHAVDCVVLCGFVASLCLFDLSALSFFTFECEPLSMDGNNEVGGRSIFVSLDDVWVVGEERRLKGTLGSSDRVLVLLGVGNGPCEKAFTTD